MSRLFEKLAASQMGLGLGVWIKGGPSRVSTIARAFVGGCAQRDWRIALA